MLEFKVVKGRIQRRRIGISPTSEKRSGRIGSELFIEEVELSMALFEISRGSTEPSSRGGGDERPGGSNKAGR